MVHSQCQTVGLRIVKVQLINHEPSYPLPLAAAMVELLKLVDWLVKLVSHLSYRHQLVGLPWPSESCCFWWLSRTVVVSNPDLHIMLDLKSPRPTVRYQICGDFVASIISYEIWFGLVEDPSRIHPLPLRHEKTSALAAGSSQVLVSGRVWSTNGGFVVH